MEPEVVEEEEPRRDPTEWLRLAILGLGLALNLYVLWDQYRDHPDVIGLRHRMSSWWEHVVAGPRREARKLRRDQGAVVFEAMQIVEGS